MNAWDIDEWDRTLTRTQDYLHNRIFGKGCDREMIEAWRQFYRTHEPIVRNLVAKAGIVGRRLDECTQEVWLEILTGLPKLSPPVTRDTFFYWLNQLVQSKTNTALHIKIDHAQSDRTRDDVSSGAPSETTDVGSVDGLPEYMRPMVAELFQLRVVEDRSIADVAQALGLSAAQVADHERRMMQRILAILIKMDAMGPAAICEWEASGSA